MRGLNKETCRLRAALYFICLQMRFSDDPEVKQNDISPNWKSISGVFLGCGCFCMCALAGDPHSLNTSVLHDSDHSPVEPVHSGDWRSLILNRMNSPDHSNTLKPAPRKFQTCGPETWCILTRRNMDNMACTELHPNLGSSCTCTHIYICIYVYRYTCICAYMYICICTYTNRCVTCVYVCI